MSKEIRNLMTTYQEFVQNMKIMQVIVSYDCSEIHDPFSNSLRNFLKEKFLSEEVTMSTYKLKTMLNMAQIDNLKQEIINLFQESTALNEGKREKRTVVKFIIPHENQFMIHEVLNEVE